MIRTFPLSTPHLYLRMFVLSDSRKAYENWMSDEDVTEFLTWNAHANPETSAAMISSWIRSYEAGTMDWCITLKSNREPIGSITAVQDFPGRRYCELGYCIAKDCWGKGYMTEAVRGVTEHIFRNTDYLWVQARCDSENFGSRRCLEKCGYEHAADLCLPCAKRNGEIRKCHMMRIERRDIIRI